ncbi:LptE family protein [Pontibacter sp. 172403-2]|uniref:LptE family protein n=1 Tax=Pontibacter rufus TaxID=2791028 RepID=UPI0018AF6862|nr:LptE family protein [Pontibacter sp. 172403-2]MBF9253809.1 LptE family protein [Pontibacter sp. 172403-2]
MTLKIKDRFILYTLSLALLLCNGCGVYSFSGTNISPDVKTISIQTIENSSGEGPANLTQVVTDNFKNYFRRNSNLTVLQNDGDLQLEGQIVSFTLSPAAIQREGLEDRAGLNRLTLGIQVRYTNTKNPEENFDRLFTISRDFGQNVDVTQIPTASINEITELLVTDVFNKTVANW